MLFLGHIGASLLIADATDSDRKMAVIGNLVPDVGDKSGSLLGLMPQSRWLLHGLPGATLVCLLMRLFLSGRGWRGFLMGYAGHLVGDLYRGGKVPWFAPFEKPYRDRRGCWGAWLLRQAPGEIIGGLVIWWVFR